MRHSVFDNKAPALFKLNNDQLALLKRNHEVVFFRIAAGLTVELSGAADEGRVAGLPYTLRRQSASSQRSRRQPRPLQRQTV